MLSTLIGVLVSTGVIVWMYLTIDWTMVGVQLARSDYRMLIPITAVLVAHFVLRAMRWRWLLPGNERISLRDLFDSIMVGTFANFILPLRAGEFIRPLLLSQRSKHSFSTGLVSVVIERFFDLCMVLLSFAVMAFVLPDVPELIQQGASALTLLAVILLAFMLIGILGPKTAEGIVDFFIDYLPEKSRTPLKKFSHDFIEGGAVLATEGRIGKVLLYTLIIWATNYLILYLFLFVYDAPAHPYAQSMGLAIAVGVVLALAVAAPSAPGFIGVYQAGCIIGFALFGIKKEPATAFAIITHVYQYIFFCAYGIYFLMTRDLTLGDLTKGRASSASS